VPADAPPANVPTAAAAASRESAAAGGQTGSAPDAAASASVAAAGTADLRIKHDWYQSDANVIISIMIKGLATDDVECVFGERALSVTAKLHTGADYK